MARAIAILLLLAFLTAGCADDDDDGEGGNGTATQTGTGGTTVSGSVSLTGTGGSGNSTHSVKVQDDKYDDDQITIKRGDTVNWTYDATASHPHSVTSRVAGLFDSSPACTAATPNECLGSGDSFEHEFDLAVGEYEYYCRIHSAMTGKVIITN